MALAVHELKAIEALVVRIKALAEDALTIAASANDAGATSDAQGAFDPGCGYRSQHSGPDQIARAAVKALPL